MDPERFLSRLRGAEAYEDQIAVARRLPEREARHRELCVELHPRALAAMQRGGPERLYVHQAEAIERLVGGRHTIVATGTASGKSVCYQVPVLHAVAADREATALYVCPTKALAQDQLRQLRRYGAVELRAEIYDGDTPTSERPGIRRHANLLLTNPDMLHVGILPHHELWGRFLRGLRYVVVDEAHWMRGVFGSHVALVLRRLRRVARSYRADPVFALASATIGNPAAHASALTGVDVEAVTDDGAPRGERHVVFWNPPLLVEGNGRRGSSNYEAASLVAELVREDARTLAFSKTRVSAELVARYARQRLGAVGPETVAAYRAGYLAHERREIEARLQNGTLEAVSATNALELGIDIGELDAVVLNGFPGTVASAWQQAGRAGRAGQPSLAIVVPQDEPLDQYYTAHPDEFFAKPHEAALVNPSNPYVLGPHLACAAYERPLSAADAAVFGDDARGLTAEMEAAGLLRERRGRWFWSQQRVPASDVDIRSSGGDRFRIVEHGTGRVVGSVDEAKAYATIHPGAVYLHQGETFRVRELVLPDRVALVESVDDAEYTQPRTQSDLVVLEEEESSRLGRDAELARGIVEVTEQVVAYQRRKAAGGEVLGVHGVDLPSQSLTTRAVWYTLPEKTLERALEPWTDEDPDALLGALHAAEHAAIGLLPVFAMCDRWDIGGLSTNLHAATGRPTIFIYDGFPMGAGIAAHAFSVVHDHLGATRRHVGSCPCEDGCPSCVQSPKCGNWNRPLHKAGAVEVLDRLLDA